MHSPPTVLLHVCCGPCATHAVSTLRTHHEVTMFFSNSNVAPQSEYELRLRHARKLVSVYGVPLMEDTYDHDAWRAHVKGHESAPEGGSRCARCFLFNLGRAATRAKDHGFDAFTTSLTVSPHKKTETIFSVGEQLGSFLPVDFKENDGFKRSVELSRDHGLYRQDFCGCEFSRREGAPDTHGRE